MQSKGKGPADFLKARCSVCISKSSVPLFVAENDHYAFSCDGRFTAR